MKVLVVYAHPNPKSFNHAVLEEFTRGLGEGGHEFEVVDLCAIKFNPVFGLHDYSFFFSETVPADVLESWNLREQIVDLSGGPLRRMIAKRWVRGRELAEILELISKNKPKDVLEQQEKVAWANGLAFVSPIYWMNFPAILRGWVERVFTYGFAYSLTAEGWRGDMAGRIPLLKHQKALIMNTTAFKEEDYKSGFEQAIERVVDEWGFRYPGIENVEHVYFYSVGFVDDMTRKRYLEKAYSLGRDF